MRKDLGMRKGKMIAQGAHASLRVLLERGAAEGDRYTIDDDARDAGVADRPLHEGLRLGR